MTNRCDSVDALMYAYYEFMRIKEENQMLEKNKDYIEFSMRSMMATHRPCQDDTEIAITGLCPGRDLLAMPFDIPCDVVVVSKRYFERLQTENEQLKKKLEEFSPVPEYSDFLKVLYPDADEETIEKLIWTTKHIFGCGDLRHNLQVDLEYYRAMSSAQAKTLHSWKEATGCSTPEEAKELIDGKKRRIIELKDELDDSLSANKELIEKRETLEGKVKVLETEAEVYSRALQEWKEITGYPSPSAVKTALESGASWCHAYHEVKGNNQKLADNVKSWQNATGYSTPGGFLSAMINDPDNVWRDATGFSSPLAANIGIRDYKNTIEKLKKITECKTLVDIINGLDQEIDKWQKAIGYDTPEETKSRIEGLENAIRLTNKNMIKEIENTIDEWQKATGCVSPEKAERKITDLYNRIDKMKEAATMASNWADKIVEG